MKYYRKIAAYLTAALVLCACQTTPDLYYWGEYEALIYKMYNRPGEATPSVQINKLTADIDRASAKGIPIAPGIYAHLGFMYAAVGNLPAAEIAMNEEKIRFPESAKFIDGMLERAKKNAKKKEEI